MQVHGDFAITSPSDDTAIFKTIFHLLDTKIAPVEASICNTSFQRLIDGKNITLRQLNRLIEISRKYEMPLVLTDDKGAWGLDHDVIASSRLQMAERILAQRDKLKELQAQPQSDFDTKQFMMTADDPLAQIIRKDADTKSEALEVADDIDGLADYMRGHLGQEYNDQARELATTAENYLRVFAALIRSEPDLWQAAAEMNSQIIT